MSNLLPQNITARCTARARRVLETTGAGRRGQTEPTDLLRALVRERGSLGANILVSHEVGNDKLWQGPAKKAVSSPNRQNPSDSLKRVLKKSVQVASEHNSRHLGTEHILASLLQEPSVRKMLSKKISRERFENLRAQLASLLSHTAQLPTLASLVDPLQEQLGADNDQSNVGGLGASRKKRSSGAPGGSIVPLPVKQKKQQQKSGVLDYFTEDLVDAARTGELDPLIGRTNEIERVIGILSRRSKNNPVLIGEAGVGKTAIIHGLAQRICTHAVPAHLAGRRLLALDLGLLIAGTVFRGEFEGRLKDVIQEAENEGAIIFIDELHTIVGAGAAQGSLDAANMLKPAIVRGSFQIIGATTTEEYRKSIEKDSAFERRFQSVLVNEPTSAETIEILKGLKKEFESYHDIVIDNEAIERAVWLAERFIIGRHFPDKAIDLLDEAAGQLRAKRTQTNAQARQFVLENDLAQIHEQKEEALRHENYEEALRLKKEEGEIKLKLHSSDRSPKGRHNKKTTDVLTVEDIERAVSQITGIDLQKITRPEKKKLLTLEKRVRKHIVGQDHAIDTVAASLRRARSGIKDTNRPIGSFLFVGPSGVGKSELAKILAQTFFEDPANFFKLDMSEYSESHTVSKLLGAPAGYIGYEDAGTFVDFVRRRPYSLILFDEIEKAHPHVQNVLLQILEDGELTDARGVKASFRNTLVILTSNTGGISARKGSGKIGFEASGGKGGTKKVNEEAYRYLRPEIVSRLDDVVVFKTLGKPEIEKIVELELKKLQQRLKGQADGLEFNYTASAVALLAACSGSSLYGARKVRTQVRKLVEEPLAQKLITDELEGRRRVTLAAAKEKLTWRSSKK